MAGGIRSALIGLVAALALATSATIAWAGGEAGKGPDPQPLLATGTASPGDTVAFAVPDTPQGARYTLEVAGGERLAQGEDTTPQPGVLDEFQMPDLGADPLKLKLLLDVLLPDGSGWKRKLSMQYLPRAQGTSDSGVPVPPAPGPGGSPPNAAVHDSGPALPALPGANVTDSAAAPADGAAGPSKRSPAKERRKPRSVGSSAKKTAGHEAARADRRRLRPLRDLARWRPSPGARPFLNEPRSPLDTTGAVPVHRPTPPGDGRVDLSKDTFPGVGWTVAWRFLAGAMALLLLLTVGVGGIVRQRRREREVELEGALQQMLAEEHVRV
jgi:hypothetical protein